MSNDDNTRKQTSPHHLSSPPVPPQPASRPCSHRHPQTGRACQAWAMKDTDPPLCSVHAGRCRSSGPPPGNENARTHGFYARRYTIEEIADLIAHAAQNTLKDEIATTRVAVSRIMKQLDRDLPPQEYARLASLLFTGANTIGRLLRTQHDLAENTDEFSAAVAQAIDELTTEWGLIL